MRRTRAPFALRIAAALAVALAFPLSVRAAEVVTCSVLPGINILSTTSISTGVNTQSTIKLPDAWASISFTNGSGAQQVAVKWVDTRTYSATPTTLDLTTLAANSSTNTGAASFAALKVIYIRNNATSAGYNLTVGNAAATQFSGPLSVNATITLGPGESTLLFNLTAGGWAVNSGAKSLKIDPGANNVSATVALAGN